MRAAAVAAALLLSDPAALEQRPLSSDAAIPVAKPASKTVRDWPWVIAQEFDDAGHPFESGLCVTDLP